MKFVTTLTAFLLLFISICECQKCDEIDYTDFDACTYPIQLKLPYGQCGTEIESVEDATSQPKVVFNEADPFRKYILIMVDPDAPSRYSPKMKFWRHWLVADISGETLQKGDVELDGDILTNYQGPLPPEGSGPHRYQFLLFKQPSTFNSNLVMLGEGLAADSSVDRSRGKFDVNRFVVQHDLCGLLAAAYEYVASRESLEAS